MKRLLLIICFLNSISLYSQNIDPFKITPDDIPFINAYEGVFDSLGFYWVGTNKGLYRYSNHRNFELAYPDTIVGKAVYGLQKDKFETIWFTNNLGKLYYIHDNSPVQYHMPYDINITAFCLQPSLDKLVIYSDFQIHELNVSNREITLKATFSPETILEQTSISNSGKLIDNKFYSLYDRLKATVLNDIKIINLEDKINEYCQSQLGFSNQITKLVFKQFNEYYIFIQCQQPTVLLCYDVRSGELKNIELGNKVSIKEKIETVNIAKENTFSINTTDGTYLYDTKENTVNSVLQTKGKVVKNLKIYKDQIWFTTNTNGIYVINQKGAQLISDDTFFKCLATKTNDFIATKKGDATIFRKNQFYKKLEIAKSDLIYSINEIGNQIEFATGKNGIKSVNKDNFDRVSDTNKSGLIYFNINKSRYRFGYINLIKNGKPLIRKRYHHYKINDDSTAVYMGHKNGLDKLDIESDSVITIAEGYICTGLNIDSKNRLWVSAGSGGGLRQYKNDELVTQYSSDDILPGNTCRTIVIDSTDIWVATDNGLLLFNPDKNLNRNFSSADGLINTDILDLSQSQDYMYIMTVKGVYYLDKRDLPKQESFPISVNIDEIKIWENDTSILKKYNLNYDQNNLYIKYLSNDFHSRGKYSYKYRMLGIDSNWTTTKSEINFARYPQLKPGNYTFQVYSSLIDGSLKSDISEIGFKIKPHFSDTLWFKFLVFTSSLLLLFWIYVANQKRKNNLKNLEQNLEAEKMRSLMRQINPHFIYNTLNSIQYFIFNDKKYEAGKYLSNFSNLMRKNFEFWTQDYILLNNEIDHIKNYLDMEKIRFEDQVDIQFHVDKSIQSKSIKIPPFIVQPFIENAFKHGIRHLSDTGILRINFKMEDDYLKITIEDNGIGRVASEKKQMNKDKETSSLKSINRRIELINNLNQNLSLPIQLNIDDLYDQNRLSTGTIVTLKFPV